MTVDAPAPVATSRRLRLAPWLTVGLLIVLAGTRLRGITRSLWHDEVYTAWAYVLRGPGTIWSLDSYIANNHVLFSGLTWLTSRVGGMAEPVLRLWAIVPALMAATWLAWWVGRRRSWWVAAVVVALLLVSPLHATLSTEARGYGLVLLAATGCLVAAADAATAPSWRGDLIVTGSILVGVLTMPSFVVPAAATAAVVLARRQRTRLRLVALGAACAILGGAWYRPLLSRLVEDRTGVGARWGEPVGLLSPVVAPAELLAVPSFEPALREVPAGAVLIIVLSLLATGVVWCWRHDRGLGWQVAAVPVLAVAIMGVMGMHLLPRYVAFVLPHIVIGVAIGVVTLVAWAAGHRRDIAAGLAVAVAVVALTRGIAAVDDSLTVPRQDFLAIGELADRVQPASTILEAHHIGFTYYLRDHDPELVEKRRLLEERVCRAAPPVLFVPPATEAGVEPACLRSRGFERHTFRQRSSPGTITVWVLEHG